MIGFTVGVVVTVGFAVFAPAQFDYVVNFIRAFWNKATEGNESEK
jgi:hypothetical protein